MMLHFSSLTNAVSQISPAVFALALFGFVLWWRNIEQLEMAQAIQPKRLAWELPPANAPPGRLGGFL